jgi:tetratricopeptide (TPR) repeat protein
MNAEWFIGLFGSFRLEQDGKVVARFGTRKEELLLAYLALAPQTSHLRDEVAGVLWPGQPRDAARRHLSYSLWSLRTQLRELGGLDAIYVGARTLQLNPAVRTDVQRFSQLLGDALHSSEPDQAADLLRDAMARYGDGLLPHYAEPWIESERKQLALAYEDARQRSALLLQTSEATVGLARHLSPTAASWRASPATVAPGPPLSTKPATSLPASDESVIALVAQAEPHLGNASRDEWLPILDERYEEIAAALDEAIRQKERHQGLSIAARLWRFWYLRGKVETGRLYLEQLLALPASNPSKELEALSLHAAGTLAFYSGDTATSQRLLQEAMALWQKLENDRGLLKTLINLGMIHYQAGDDDEAYRIYTQAAAIARQIDDPQALATVLMNASLIDLRHRRADPMRALLMERLELADRAADPLVRTSTIAQLSVEALLREDLSAAKDYAQEALELLSRHPDLRLEAITLRILGQVAHKEQSYREAIQYFARSLRAGQVLGDFWEMGQTYLYQGLNYRDAGYPRKACRSLLQAIQFLGAAGDVVGVGYAQEAYDEVKGRARWPSP